MAWADGGGAEEAIELALSLSDKGWEELVSIRAKRSAGWRACLVCVLQPRSGGVAQRLLLESASDQDDQVAFLAVRSIAFYCGINASAKGPFVDPKIRSEAFLSQARASGIIERVRKVSSLCAPVFHRQFDLLEAVLEEKA